MADLAAQLEQVKAKAKEVILKQKQEIETANLTVNELKNELSRAQSRCQDYEKALEAEKVALKSANEALAEARSHGGLSLSELAKIGNERQAERESAMLLAETLSTTQKQLVEVKKELASAQYARQEAERARREDVEAVRSRLEREFGEEKTRLASELSAACAELNLARAEAIHTSGAEVSKLQSDVERLKEALKRQVSEAEAAKADHAATLAKLKEATREHVSGLKAELDASKHAHDQLKEHVQTLLAEKEHASRAEAELEQFKEQAKQHVQGLLAEREQLKAHASRAEAELEQLREQAKQHVQGLLADKAQLEAGLGQLQRERDELRAQLGEAGSAAHGLQRERDELRMQLNEAALARQRVEEALAVATSSTNQAAAQSAESHRLKSEIERLQKELDRAEETMARWAEQRASSNMSGNSAVAAKDAALADERRRREEAEATVKQVKAEAEEKRMQIKTFVEKMRKEQADKEEELGRELAETKQALSAALKELSQPGRAQASQQPPLPSPASQPVSSEPPTANGAGNKAKLAQLEEARTKAEVMMREALDEAAKAKRDHAAAKREAIALAKSLDKLKGSLGRATMMASGSMSLATDRFEDALKSCDSTVEGALAAVEAKQDKTGAPPSRKSSRVPVRRHATSNTSQVQEEPNLSDEEKLMQVLLNMEQRLDTLTETSRQLLPKIKEVCTLAVQDKQAPGSCGGDVRRLLQTLFRGGESSNQSAYNKVARDEDAPPKYSSARIEPEFEDDES